MKKKITLIMALVLVAALLMGCSARKYAAQDTKAEDSGYYKNSSAPMAAESAAWEVEALDYPLEEGFYTEETGGGLDSSLLGNVPGRKIIKNADLSLQTLEYDSFLSGLSSTIKELGGYIESSNTDDNSYAKHSLRYARLSVRIPSEKLDSFLSTIGEMANITNTNIYTEDVTLSYVDTESRLKSMRVEQETLLSLLEKAETVEDIIIIQNRLSEVRYQIEGYESRLRVFDNQINYSTVNLNIREVERETQIQKETPGEEMARRLAENWEDLKDGTERFGIDFVSNLPYIILWVIILVIPGIIVLIATRKLRKSSREKKKQRKAEKKAAKEAAKAQKMAAKGETK